MALYTFRLCKPNGFSASFEAYELSGDGESLARAAELLDEHLNCDHIEVWAGERPVLARHRFQPVIRPVDEPAQMSAL